MKIAIGQAYNGIHKIFNRHLKALGAKTFYFNIDRADWFGVEEKNPDAYIWLADQKEERYREIHDRTYFIQNIIKKPVFPDMAMYFSEGDKVKQNQIFKYHKIPTLKTHIAFNKNKALAIINRIKFPFILKDPYGYGGLHVFKIENKKQASTYIKKIFGSGLKTGCSICKDIFYAQEFIEVERDLRVITIGGKTFCAYWRQGAPKAWKHNLEQGAEVSFESIPKKALLLCEKFSRQMNFHWMGFDLFILKNNNVKMIEYSANVRTKGAEEGGFDVRRAQMEYVANYLKGKK